MATHQHSLIRAFLTSVVRSAGLLFGTLLIAQGALWVISPQESLVFLLWSSPGIIAAAVAMIAGTGLILGYVTQSLPKARWAALMLLPGISWALWDTCNIWWLGFNSTTVELKWLAWWPSSLVLAFALLVPGLVNIYHAKHNTQPPQATTRKKIAGFVLRFGFAGGLIALGILHAVVATGHTDYQRKADTAVVLGARAYKNNIPSDALRDRIMTGVDLYKQGRVKRLLMTGGMSEKIISEPKVMKHYAIKHGVPAHAIILDEKGDNTAASIRNLVALKKQHSLGRLLIVSHDHHTLRLKLSCHRLGLKCYTVPAVQPKRLSAEPYYIAREVAGVLHYALFFR